METLNTTKPAATVNILELLTDFVNQRPCLSFADYGDMKYYRQDYNEILKDKHSFFELLGLAVRRIGREELNKRLFTRLLNSGGRLSLREDTKNGGYKLEYITGQYWPTEYRNAGCRALVSVIWSDYAEEKRGDGTHIYENGEAIRKAIKRNFSSRNTKLYFS